MEDLYAIVHEPFIHKELESLRKQGAGLGRLPEIIKELDRIKREEKWVAINPSQRPSNISYATEDKRILVCGAYGELCVRAHAEALEERGVPVGYHDPGILFGFKDIFLESFFIDINLHDLPEW